MTFTSALFWMWMVLAAGLALVWIGRLFVVRAVASRRAVLGSRSYDGAPNPAPKVSVVVAAKDEEANIEACVSTLLDQDYPNYELIVVDDRSADETPAILRRLEDEAPGRLRVVTVTRMREGWFGKNNAMREGVAVSTGDWLLFTDADCRQISRKTISVAMREALHHDADFLSVTPILETHTAWERIIQPVCALVLIVWFLPEKVNNPDKSVAYANGAFMLMRRGCYDAIGGHEAVRTELNEDIRMAQIAKRSGLRLRVTENEDLYLTRMYDTPAAAWHGWSRIFFGSLTTMRRLLGSAGHLLVWSLLPWLSLTAAVTGWLVTRPGTTGDAVPWAWAVGAWLGVVSLEQIVTWQIYKMLRIASVWSLAYVLGCVAALGMLISAMLKVLGATATTWRGTTYQGDRRSEPGASTTEKGTGTPVPSPATSPSAEEPAPHA